MTAWRQNVLSGHWALDVPERRDRPQGALTPCPFCPGQEAKTPATVEQFPKDGVWQARAFPNAFPIVEHHEVLVDTRRHVASFHQLTEPEAVLAVRLWASRMKAARERRLSPLLYRNDGPRAGASMPHAHAQLVAARDAFPRVAHEAKTFAARCPFEAPGFAHEERTIGEFRVIRPTVARFPGERWILPVDHVPEFEPSGERTLEAFARVLRDETTSLAAAGMGDYNVVLHSAPAGSRDYHWHAEVLPRRDGIGGFELGAGVFANAGP